MADDFTEQQRAAYKELGGRLDSLNPNQRAAYDELGKRMNKPAEMGFGERMGQTVVGMAKGLGHTALNLGELADKVNPATYLFPSQHKQQTEFNARLRKTLQTTNPSQEVGYWAEQVLEFFAPVGEEKLIAAAPKGLRFLARAAMDATKTGTVAAAQTGSVRLGAEAAATAGGFSLLGSALSVPLTAAGRKIQASTIHPRGTDMTDGFKWSVLDRFKLKGNLAQSLKQVDTELSRLRTARDSMIKPGAASVNLSSVFDDVEKELAGEVGQLKHAGWASSSTEALKALRDDVMKAAGNSTIDIKQAENAKEHFGMMGSWAYGRPDKEAKVSELVANKVYLRMKTAIEDALGSQGQDVKALNKQMQELIPVKHAMVARLPVEERNRMFSLADMAALIPAAVTGDARMLALEGLTRAQKSLRFGNWLVRTPAAPRLGSAVGKAAGAAMSASHQDDTPAQ